MKEVTNMWNKVSVWCLNHDSPKPMTIIQNTEIVKTPFYACSSKVDGTDECANRLNLDDYQDIVLKFFDYVAENPFADLTNYAFTHKGHRQNIFVKVLKYKDDDIQLGIKNKTVLGG